MPTSSPLEIVVRGRHLPGRTFRNAGVPIHGVHVGVQVGCDAVGLVPADRESAAWSVQVRVATDSTGRLDFRGPAVHGSRGHRFLYLTWGDVTADSPFTMFRRAKLMLDAIDPDLVRAALDGAGRLVATVDLTDAYGGPRCGQVDGPAVRWSV